MRALLSVLLFLPVSFPCYCYAWTGHEWLGVIEAVAGTVVLRASDTPSSDICENCNGTGKLGDGVVSVKCPVCDGTGKPATIKDDPTPSGMDAPAVKQDAATSGGGTYKRGLLRRR
tara:strand:+ start:5664 stop:6011 length:348 start_codon:yes stop_codon:yes gene_type:complete